VALGWVKIWIAKEKGEIIVWISKCFCAMGLQQLLLKWSKHRYQIKCARRVSGTTFNKYAQYRKFVKPNNLRVIKPTGLNRTAEICLREENLSFVNNSVVLSIHDMQLLHFPRATYVLHLFRITDKRLLQRIIPRSGETMPYFILHLGFHQCK